MGVLTLLSMVALSVLQLVSAQPTTDASEVAALKKIIEYWNLGSSLNLTVDPCTKNASWASDNANPRIVCDCSSSICHITHFKAYALDIVGDLPRELFALKELLDLNLAQNVLSGPIPSEFGQLLNMQYLSLGINNLTGEVPQEIGHLTKLVSLSFSSNNFNGSLPAELGNLTSLEELYIDSSGLSGPIPQNLSNLKLLKKLWASDNLFTGKLPEFFGTFTELMDLRFEGTLLEGPIPDIFGPLTKLQTLIIGDLGGEDSSLSFLRNQTSLSVLSLRNCQVSGQIPEIIGSFSNLIYLDLSFNKLDGPIPVSFQEFTRLKYLFLGNNNLSGEIPANIISHDLIALDVSFNPLSGNLPVNADMTGFSMNFVGTSLNVDNLMNRKAFDMLSCVQGNIKCSSKVKSTSFSVNCGGTEQVSASGIKYSDDSEVLGAASVYVSLDRQWGISDSGYFMFNSKGPQYIVKTESQITGTLDSELYQTARASASSLRYNGLGLKNGRYNVELHFAEIRMVDSESWKGLGRRLFDVYIQSERVLQDLNIQKEAGGSNRALVKTFDANVTNTVLDIHLRWAGKGTCCIPSQGTYGPLVSAIRVAPVAGVADSSSDHDKRHLARTVGVVFLCAAALVVTSSIFYLWRAKNKSSGHMRVYTESPRRRRFSQ